jgi:hypothetical protein
MSGLTLSRTTGKGRRLVPLMAANRPPIADTLQKSQGKAIRN